MRSPNLRHLLPVFAATPGSKVVPLDWPFYYLILRGIQQTDANLAPMEHPLEHRFAVVHKDGLDNEWEETLERVHDMGGLSPVTLVDVSENYFYVLLNAQTSSRTVNNIEAIWSAAITAGNGRRRTVSFSSESEIWTERSDYAYVRAAKVIFDTNLLGVLPAPSAESEDRDNDHHTVADSKVSQADIKRLFGHITQAMTEYYIKQGCELDRQPSDGLKCLVGLVSGLRMAQIDTITAECPFS